MWTTSAPTPAHHPIRGSITSCLLCPVVEISGNSTWSIYNKILFLEDALTRRPVPYSSLMSSRHGDGHGFGQQVLGVNPALSLMSWCGGENDTPTTDTPCTHMAPHRPRPFPPAISLDSHGGPAWQRSYVISFYRW